MQKSLNGLNRDRLKAISGMCLLVEQKAIYLASKSDNSEFLRYEADICRAIKTFDNMITEMNKLKIEIKNSDWR